MSKLPSQTLVVLRRVLWGLLWGLFWLGGTSAQAQALLSLGRFSASTLADHALHTVYDDGARIWLLASTRVEPATFYRNPDGGKAYLRDLHLVRIGANAEVTRLTLGQVANGDAYPGVGALLVDGATVYAFQNSVQYSSQGAFGLEGFVYTVQGDTMVLDSAERLFSNANWGWHPVLYAGPLLSHFSYAGYRRHFDTLDLGDASPATLMAEYDTSVAAQARGLVLAHEAQQLQQYAPTILARIAARLAGPPPAPEAVVLPALPALSLPVPPRPALGAVPTLRLAASGAHALAVDNTGVLMAWGDDSGGQLGLSRLVKSLVPTTVDGSYSQIEAGQDHTLALRPDGTLWAWGANESGQLGDGTGIHRASPVQIQGHWVAIAAGGRHSLALQADGSLWAWGRNTQGQLGDGTQIRRFVPTRVGAGFVSLAAGDAHSLARTADGGVWAWGANERGQLGDGSGRMQLRPVPVAQGVQRVVARENSSYAILNDSSLWSWGGNSAGQLGDGSQSDRALAVRVGAGYSAVAAGWGHALALKTDGSLWSWGRNFGGQLGDGSITGHLTPQPIGTGYTAIAAGGAHSLGLQADGSVWAWGYNVNGVLGLGHTAHCTQPCRVGVRAVMLAAGFSHSLALQAQGALQVWGNNASDQLGVGQAGSGVYQSAPRALGRAYLSAATGARHSLALQPDGSVWSWGENDEGQLGNAQAGYQLYQNTPGRVVGDTVHMAAGGAHSLALQADGSLWGWGYGFYGQLGQGTWERQTTPTRLGSDYVAAAAGAAHTLALQADGSLWAWGNHHFGQLGVAQESVRDERAWPVWVGSGFVAVAAGAWHSLALKTDGSLWAWGQNHWGQLGNGYAAYGAAVAEPVRIGGGFTAIAAGAQHSLALRSDGSLWAWGDNRRGQLGLGHTHPRRVPALVGSGFVAITAGGQQSLGMRADGTVWAWGANHAGQLGDGTFSDRNAPTLALNPQHRGFLDLDPGTPNSLPPGAAPPFLAKASRAGDLTALSLSVDVYGPLSANAAARATAAGRYNIYVAALAGAAGALGWFQLDDARNWSTLSWPMSSYMSGVALTSSLDTATVDIFSGLDVSALGGSRIYVGFGTDAQEMLSAGRYREVMTIPVP